MNFKKTLSNLPRWFIMIAGAFFLIFPIIAIIPMSLSSGESLSFPPPGFSIQWYETFFNSADWTGSFWVSVQVALITVVLCLATGIPAAFALSSERLHFKGVWLSFFALPMVFPVVVSAVALTYFFSDLNLVGTKFGLALAHTTLGLPVVILPTVAALKRFEWDLVWQARNLGAGPIRAFLTVTLPLLRTTFITAALFAFVTSFDEVIFAIFIGSAENLTLPQKIWEGWRFEQQPTLAVIASFLIVVTMSIISGSVISQYVRDRRK